MAWALKTGATRTVILTRRWAIKLPGRWSAHPRHWWRTLLLGLLANMEERAFSTLGWHQLCPVVRSWPGGTLVVMPRAKPLDAQADLALDRRQFFADRAIPPLSESKRENYGIYDGRIVAVDYG